MTMIRMYVSRSFVFADSKAEHAVSEIERDIAQHFGGFTVMPHARGMWIDPDGASHFDVVDVYDIMVDDNTSTLIMKEFANRFANAYGQECIPYSIMRSENHFMDVSDA